MITGVNLSLDIAILAILLIAAGVLGAALALLNRKRIAAKETEAPLHILRAGSSAERQEALERIAKVMRRAESDPHTIDEVSAHLRGEGFILVDPLIDEDGDQRGDDFSTFEELKLLTFSRTAKSKAA